jgi:nitroreductase
METIQAIRGRKSIRAYLPTPVPKELIAEVLEASRWAPSGSNRQGWRVTVAAGATCRTLADRLTEKARERQPHLSSAAGAAPDVEERVNTLRVSLGRAAEALGCSRWEFVVLGSYRLYDAPVVVVVSHRRERADVSTFVTTMLLAAHDLGLGTCWLGYPLGASDVIREVLCIPEEEHIRAVVSLGYPDLDSPANAFRSSRDEVNDFARWVGFDEASEADDACQDGSLDV